jgi:hypothetical protein
MPDPVPEAATINADKDLRNAEKGVPPASTDKKPTSNTWLTKSKIARGLLFLVLLVCVIVIPTTVIKIDDSSDDSSVDNPDEPFHSTEPPKGYYTVAEPSFLVTEGLFNATIELLNEGATEG